MKKVLLMLVFALMFTGCEGKNISDQPQTAEIPQKDENFVYVESGSAVWGGFGDMGEAKFDIDNDGTEELVFLDPGPTSGVFTIMLTTTEDDGNYDIKYQNIYAPPAGSTELTEVDGKTKLKYEEEIYNAQTQTSYDAEPHYYDIEVKDKAITLSENGKPFPAFGGRSREYH